MSHAHTPPTSPRDTTAVPSSPGEFHRHGDPFLATTTLQKHDEADQQLKVMIHDSHRHGDPFLEAIQKHDEADREKNWKEIYDKHAKMLHHERAGVLLGDTWIMQDCKMVLHKCGVHTMHVRTHRDQV